MHGRGSAANGDVDARGRTSASATRGAARQTRSFRSSDQQDAKTQIRGWTEHTRGTTWCARDPQRTRVVQCRPRRGHIERDGSCDRCPIELGRERHRDDCMLRANLATSRSLERRLGCLAGLGVIRRAAALGPHAPVPHRADVREHARRHPSQHDGEEHERRGERPTHEASVARPPGPPFARYRSGGREGSITGDGRASRVRSPIAFADDA